jgi:hypothetical protein
MGVRDTIYLTTQPLKKELQKLQFQILQSPNRNTQVFSFSTHNTLAPAVLTQVELNQAHIFNHTNLLDYFHETNLISNEQQLISSIQESELDLCFQIMRVPLIQSSNPIFVAKCLNNALESQKTVSVNFYKDWFEIAITKENTIIFYNTYHYTTIEEFSYYILFCFEKTNCELQHTQLQLTGEISSNSAAYKVCKKYIKRVKIGLDSDTPDCRFELF